MDQQLINIILVTASFTGGIAYVVTKMFSGSNKAVAESNQLLRSLIDDQKTEIGKLRERLHNFDNDMTAIKLQVQMLRDRRDYLEKLIGSALREHFASDPDLAKKVKNLLTSE